MIPLIWHSSLDTAKLQAQKRYQWLPESRSERGQELTTKTLEGIFFLMIKLLYLNFDGGYILVCICQNSYDYAWPRVNFFCMQIYLNF